MHIGALERAACADTPSGCARRRLGTRRRRACARGGRAHPAPHPSLSWCRPGLSECRRGGASVRVSRRGRARRDGPKGRECRADCPPHAPAASSCAATATSAGWLTTEGTSAEGRIVSASRRRARARSIDAALLPRVHRSECRRATRRLTWHRLHAPGTASGGALPSTAVSTTAGTQTASVARSTATCSASEDIAQRNGEDSEIAEAEAMNSVDRNWPTRFFSLCACHVIRSSSCADEPRLGALCRSLLRVAAWARLARLARAWGARGAAARLVSLQRPLRRLSARA